MKVNLLSADMAAHARQQVRRVQRREASLAYYHRHASDPAFLRAKADIQKARRDALGEDYLAPQREYMGEYRKTPKAKAANRAYMRKLREERRALVWEHKSRPCMDCKQTFHPVAMQFDHRSGERKFFNIGEFITKVSVAELLAEIAKCDVVCANCHAVRTHIGRT